jgi:hypothetical protein
VSLVACAFSTTIVFDLFIAAVFNRKLAWSCSSPGARRLFGESNA